MEPLSQSAGDRDFNDTLEMLFWLELLCSLLFVSLAIVFVLVEVMMLYSPFPPETASIYAMQQFLKLESQSKLM